MIALAVWIAGGIGAWLWAWGCWLVALWWGAAALALDALLKYCGMLFLFERASRWWKGC